MISKKNRKDFTDTYLYLKKYPNINTVSTYTETSDTVHDTVSDQSKKNESPVLKSIPSPPEAAHSKKKTIKKLKKQDSNVLSSYLKDIRNWPIFSKEEEQYFAKALEEAEYKKRIIIRRWADTYAKLLDWVNLYKMVCKDPHEIPDKKVLKLIKYLEIIKEKNTNIRELDKILVNNKLSYYMTKKYCEQKSRLVKEIHEITAKLKLHLLYRKGTVKKLKAFMIHNKIGSKKYSRTIYKLLREYVRIDKKTKSLKDDLVRANLRLVVGIAKKYINRGSPYQI